jgi:hypothetical protein
MYTDSVCFIEIDNHPKFPAAILKNPYLAICFTNLMLPMLTYQTDYYFPSNMFIIVFTCRGTNDDTPLGVKPQINFFNVFYYICVFSSLPDHFILSLSFPSNKDKIIMKN